MTFNTGDVHISEFSILGLHGNKNIRLKLEDNTLILVGENGTHKTTILTLFYSFLAGDVARLAKYNFNSLKIVINDKPFLFEDTQIFSELNRLRKRLLPPRLRVHIEEKDHVTNEEIIEILKADGAPKSHIYKIEQELTNLLDDCENFEKNGFKVFKDIKELLEPCHLLFLPTYRRIEKQLKDLLALKERMTYGSYDYESGLKSFTSKDYCTESIKFGMEDIQDIWDETIAELKNKATQGIKKLDKEYIEELLTNQHKSINIKDLNFGESIKKRVFDRIKEEGISKEALDKLEKLISGGLNDKQVIYFFKKRYDLYGKLFEYEEPLKALCDACNRYLRSNEIVFNPVKLEVYIRNRKTSESSPEQRIQLDQLSSGEKQLVSLFTHLYLAEGKQYFVIIDEPEISLSLEWQKTFLQDLRQGTFCSGLFVATHSPFMFANDLLRPYAHGVGEFLEVVEEQEAS